MLRGNCSRAAARFSRSIREVARIPLGLGGARSGDLARAIRASVAIPFVFDPVIIDGRRLVDGGLSENVPVRLARELGATRVILSTLEGRGTMDSTSRGAAAGTIDMLLDRIFLDAHPPLAAGDVEEERMYQDRTNLDFRRRSRAIERVEPLRSRDCGSSCCHDGAE